VDQQRQLAAKEGGFSEHYQPAPPRSPASANFQPSQQSYYDRASPAPSYHQQAPPRNDGQNRAANNPSPWQRGAGYDH
jgi:hypothetical protein